MAHFSELESKVDPTGFTTDTHLIVKRVVVVGNDIPANGGTLEDNDMHVDGETWCQNFFGGGTWKQTSYNNNFRKQYGGVGFRYDSAKDKFIRLQPYASWTLDSNDDWQAPVAYPTIVSYVEDEVTTSYKIVWDEDAYNADTASPKTAGWKATKPTDTNDPKTEYSWNGTAWV